MKKKSVLLIILFISINNAFAQIIDYDIIGVYLPVEYVETLKRTKHNPTAWAAFDQAKTVYVVDAHTITVRGRFDEYYNVYLWDIFKFKFENTNKDTYLIDDEGNRFIKIPGDLYEFEDWSDIISNFIGKIIFDDLIKNDDIILNNDLITLPSLDNKVYRIQWQAYDPEEKRNLHLEGITDYSTLSLEIRQNEYVFYGYHYFSKEIVWSKSYDKEIQQHMKGSFK
jgi:hypothetical protein